MDGTLYVVLLAVEAATDAVAAAWQLGLASLAISSR